MKKIFVLATAGAGGDLQPLIAAALGLRKRGHWVMIFGDASVQAAVRDLGIETTVSAPEHDLGPRLIAAIKESQGLEPSAQGEAVRQRMAVWSTELSQVVQRLLRDHTPDLLLTSLFGVSVASRACSKDKIPWCVVNSTFYVGPNPPRNLESDFAPRAVPLIRYFSTFLGEAHLVLHATDQIFDFSNTRIPKNHHYVGPLIWEAPASSPHYLDEPGNPWVLATLSSQQQDDVPLAKMALLTLAREPVRVVLTIGSGHQLAELGDLPANAKVEQYIPHSKALERSRLLLSHAGHGSVMKALWYGVPMVLIPWGRDQPGVAARAEQLGVAKVIARDQLTDERLAETVKLILEEHDIRERTSQVARRLRKQDPISTVCELLEQA